MDLFGAEPAAPERIIDTFLDQMSSDVLKGLLRDAEYQETSSAG
jgi:hypothetical protein